MREVVYVARQQEREEICKIFWPENLKDWDKFVCIDVDGKKLLEWKSWAQIQ